MARNTRLLCATALEQIETQDREQNRDRDDRERGAQALLPAQRGLDRPPCDVRKNGDDIQLHSRHHLLREGVLSAGVRLGNRPGVVEYMREAGDDGETDIHDDTRHGRQEQSSLATPAIRLSP